MYQLISDRLRRVAALIEIDESKANVEPQDNLPSAPKVKPKRRMVKERRVMSPGTEEGKQQRKDYQSQYRADGDDIGNRYVKKPKI